MHGNNYISFEYEGASSTDFKIMVTKVNNLSSSEKNISVVEIDGNDTPFVIDKKNYKPFYLEMECVIDSEGFDLKELARNIKMWLQGNTNFSKLVIDNDPEYYYEAICFNKLDISEVIEILGEFKLTFLCKPLKKYKNGDDPIIIYNHEQLYNKWYTTNPVIKVVGNGDITISINNQKLILEDVEGEIIVDSELMNAYRIVNGIIKLHNNKMYSEFPVLSPGLNNISWIGNVSYLEIVPRWAVV